MSESEEMRETTMRRERKSERGLSSFFFFFFSFSKILPFTFPPPPPLRSSRFDDIDINKEKRKMINFGDEEGGRERERENEREERAWEKMDEVEFFFPSARKRRGTTFVGL